VNLAQVREIADLYLTRLDQRMERRLAEFRRQAPEAVNRPGRLVHEYNETDHAKVQHQR